MPQVDRSRLLLRAAGLIRERVEALALAEVPRASPPENMLSLSLFVFFPCLSCGMIHYARAAARFKYVDCISPRWRFLL